VDCVGLTVMHLIGRHQADAGMMMLLIIPIEEVAAERLGILNAAEALWNGFHRWNRSGDAAQGSGGDGGGNRNSNVSESTEPTRPCARPSTS